MIRAFVGVRIDAGVVEKIFAVQAELKQSLKGIRWVGKENFHFTLKFLGGVEERRVGEIGEALERSVRAVAPFSVTGRGIGVFPDIRRARVLWVGLEGEELAALAEAVEAALEPLGFERERREFQPHLTLGRWRDFERRSELLKRELERFKDCDFGASRVDEVVLFQSVLRPEGSLYSPLRVIPLGGERVPLRS